MGGWQPSTVVAILSNPRYTGYAVYGRWQKVEELLDPDDVAAVMAAAGVRGADDEPFESWLATNCTMAGRDDRPGTVLVWRDVQGNNTHAAVTLGGGWALHKPSQEWRSPRQVLTVRDLIHLAPPGVILHRYSLQGADGARSASPCAPTDRPSSPD